MLLARGQGARAVAQCRRVQHGCSTAARSAATVPCSPAGQPTPRRAGASLAATTPASSQPAATATGPAGSEPRQGGSGGAEEPSVLVTYRGNTVAVRRGATLRTALLQSGLTPHNGNAKVINCRGLGTCGTCAVEVRSGCVEPAEWTTAERLRLNFPPHRAPSNARLRLACQVSCESDLAVVKYDRFWGQGDAEVGPMAPDGANAALGQLEYVLDRRRNDK